MLSFLPTRKFGYRRPIQIRWVLFFLSLQIYFHLFFLQLMLNWRKFHLKDAASSLFGGAPSCFLTFDNQTKQTWRPVYSSLPFFPSSVLPPPWRAGQTRLDSWVRGLFWGLSCLPCCVALLKSPPSACISFCCCSVCLHTWQQIWHLLCCTCLRLWESCYSISGCCATVSVCVCVCLWMQDSGKSGVHLTELFSLYLISSYFWVFFSCSLEPNQGFITKQESPVHTMKSSNKAKRGERLCLTMFLCPVLWFVILLPHCYVLSSLQEVQICTFSISASKTHWILQYSTSVSQLIFLPASCLCPTQK